MINVSDAFKRTMLERTDFREEAKVTLLDGTTLTFDENDFSVDNNGFTDGAGESTLPLGCAIGRTARIELWNGDEHLNQYDFFGATIILSLTYWLDDGTIEKVGIGEFTVIEPETLGETVIISASDAMWKADKDYDSPLLYPATTGAIFRDACTRCGIAYETATFPNDDFEVEQAPDGVTYRQVLGYVAMLAGGNARINRSGKMEILTYDFGSLRADKSTKRHELTEWNDAPKVDTSDICITGVKTKVTVETDDGSEDQDIICGEDGYVISVDNPLIVGKEQEAVDLIGAALVGASFRKFQGTYIAYPLAEFMDQVAIVDRRGNTYYSVITDIDFSFFGQTEISNSAASAIRNNGTYQTPENSAVLAARRLVVKERTARENAVAALNFKLDNSSGLYSTDVEQQDGSVIHYLHDKPTLGESTNVIKIVSDAIGFSTDGGASYPFGVEVSGDVIARILSVIGINADWINVGHISTELVSNLDEILDGINKSISDTQGDLRVASTGIEQNLHYIEALQGELKETQGYIRTGIVDYDGSTPIFGIAIGQNLQTSVDNNGNTVISKKNFRAIYTSKKLAFWEDGVEVAYIQYNKLYITNVVAISNLTVGEWSISGANAASGLVLKWIGGGS